MKRTGRPPRPRAAVGKFHTAMEAFERELLERAVSAHGGDIKAAAGELGLPLHVLELKLERFTILPPARPANPASFFTVPAGPQRSGGVAKR